MSLKLFGKNSLIYSFGNVALRISSFLLIPLYTNYLSIAEYGILATLLITIQFLMKLINFGLLNSLMRFMPEYRENNQVGRFMASAMLLNLTSGAVISLLAATVLTPVLRTVFHADNVSNYIVLTTLAAFAQSLCINSMSYFRANNKGAAFSLLNILISLAIIGGNILVVTHTNLRIHGVMLVQIISYGFFWILITGYILAREGFGISPAIYSRLYRFGYPLIFANIGGLLVNTSSVYFLGYFTNLETVAIYSLALKIAQISSMVLVLPFQYAYEPFVFSNMKNPHLDKLVSKLTTVLVGSFLVVSFGIVVTFRDLIRLMAPAEYYPAYKYVYLLLPAIGFIGLSYIGQSLLHLENKTKTSGFTIGLVAAISVTINYFLVQVIGIDGVVIAYNFKQITVGVLMMALGIKTFYVPLEWRRLLTLVGLYALSMIAIYYFHDQGTILYYSFVALWASSVAVWLWKGNFMTASEKRKLADLLVKRVKRLPGFRPVKFHPGNA